MYKHLLVFLVGIIETIMYTAYIISVEKRQPIMASVWMSAYMLVYLTIIAWAIKDADTFTLLLIYAIACGFGTYIRIQFEKRKKHA